MSVATKFWYQNLPQTVGNNISENQKLSPSVFFLTNLNLWQPLKMR